MSIEKHFGRIDAFKHVIELCDEFGKEPIQKLDNSRCDRREVIMAIKLVNLTLNGVKQFCKDSIDLCETNIAGISEDMEKESTEVDYDEASSGK
jgi:hypothetical protein